MLSECRKALRITTEAYDGELCSLMDAGARDLAIAGVQLPGTVSFTLVSTTTGTGNNQVTETYYRDDSTLTDALAMRAIFTYVRMHFGSPDDWERVRESYNIQKTQLMHATGYTDYGEDEETEPEEDGEGE